MIFSSAIGSSECKATKGSVIILPASQGESVKTGKAGRGREAGRLYKMVQRDLKDHF